jgi:acetyl-CoA synthetase
MIDIWENPQRFQKYFQNDWFVTGDRAYRDEDGYFWFVGRADDMIKTAGERVGPFEVEAALMSHPDVVEAAVVGKPDPVRGQIIKAFVVLKKGFKGDEGFKGELQEYVKRILAGHAYPREIEFVEELPKTRSGKIIRRILRTQ